MGPAGNSQRGQGPIIRETGVGVPSPEGGGEWESLGKGGDPGGQGDASGAGSKQGMFLTSMTSPKQHIPCATLPRAHSSRLRVTRAHTTVCQG